MARVTAVVDFGSNSVRLVIFERTSRFGFKIIHESKSRVRIGEGAYQNGGTLQAKPIERAILALKGFNSIIKAFKTRKILAIATSALRDAPNRNIFLNRVKKELGINIKVINGEQEALFGGIACSNLLENQRGVTIDIGGGSTEFALLDNKKVLQTFSLNLGTVRLKELFGFNNDFYGAIEYIKKEIKQIPIELREKQLITIGGTGRAIAKTILKKNSYPLKRLHGYEYLYQNEKEFLYKMISSSKSELLKIGIKKDRVDVIQWGLLIFREVAELFQVEKVTASGVGVREGLFLHDILRGVGGKFPNNFNPSIRNILDEFQVSNEKVLRHSVRVTNTLFNLLKDSMNLDESYREVLIFASKLAEVGIKVDFYGNTKNGFYLILNQLTYNISHQASLLIAILVRFSNKSYLSEKVFKEYSGILPDKLQVVNLHSIFYISRLLVSDFNQKSNFQFQYQNNKLIINIFDEVLFYMVNERIEKLKNLEVEVRLILT